MRGRRGTERGGVIKGAIDDRVGRWRTESRAQHAEVLAKLDSVMQRLDRSDLYRRRDLGYALDLLATASSAELVLEHLAQARTFPHPDDTLRHALSLAPNDGGLTLEFGVASGHTLGIIAAARPQPAYGFDSFEGLPERWRTGFEPGAFSAVKAPQVAGAELVVGLFADTLPGFLSKHLEHVSFLHLDADLYSSTTQVLDLLASRLRPGAIVVFDEYFNYPGWQRHEHRAWAETVARTGIAFEYVAYTIDNEQVVIRVLESAGGAGA